MGYPATAGPEALMGEFPRKADGRRVFAVEFKRGVVQHLLKGKKTLAELSRARTSASARRPVRPVTPAQTDRRRWADLRSGVGSTEQPRERTTTSCPASTRCTKTATPPGCVS